MLWLWLCGLCECVVLIITALTLTQYNNSNILHTDTNFWNQNITFRYWIELMVFIFVFINSILDFRSFGFKRAQPFKKSRELFPPLFVFVHRHRHRHRHTFMRCNHMQASANLRNQIHSMNPEQHFRNTFIPYSNSFYIPHLFGTHFDMDMERKTKLNFRNGFGWNCARTGVNSRNRTINLTTERNMLSSLCTSSRHAKLKLYSANWFKLPAKSSQLHHTYRWRCVCINFAFLLLISELKRFSYEKTAFCMHNYGSWINEHNSNEIIWYGMNCSFQMHIALKTKENNGSLYLFQTWNYLEFIWATWNVCCV